MTDQELLDELRQWVDRARDFSGWDFSELAIEDVDPGPPWDYLELAAELGRTAASALDLGTGGGERLASIRDRLPSRLVATEHWHVNAPIAASRLRPLGVEVIRASADHAPYPFRDGAFDLILDRHEALVPEEIPRLLRPGGHLVMQQVGPHNNREVQAAFPRYDAFASTRDEYLDGLRAGGLSIEAFAEHHHRVAHRGIGPLAYYLAIIPWNIDAFDVVADFDALRSLAETADEQDRILVTQCHWYVVASKPS